MDLVDQYPRPRVGQVVTLRTGRTATVTAVRKANDLLRSLKDGAALVFASQARSLFGERWREVYYEADVVFQGGAITTVMASEVLSVNDPS
jgi:hypothetical protein